MDKVLSELAKLPTSTISDALDRLGIAGQLPGIYAVIPGSHLAGRAYTIQYEPIGTSGGTVGDFIDDVASDRVLVLDNAARTDATVWGDILTSVAHRRGLQGTVINGVCRDTDRVHELAYPVFSVGRWMRTGKDRVRMAAVNVELTISGISVRPGDVIIGDRDGVVVVPAARETDVLAAACEIEEAEAAIRARVASGSRLDEARLQAGYHSLQTKVNS